MFRKTGGGARGENRISQPASPQTLQSHSSLAVGLPRNNHLTHLQIATVVPTAGGRCEDQKSRTYKCRKQPVQVKPTVNICEVGSEIPPNSWGLAELSWLPQDPPGGHGTVRVWTCFQSLPLLLQTVPHFSLGWSGPRKSPSTARGSAPAGQLPSLSLQGSSSNTRPHPPVSSLSPSPSDTSSQGWWMCKCWKAQLRNHYRTSAVSIPVRLFPVPPGRDFFLSQYLTLLSDNCQEQAYSVPSSLRQIGLKGIFFPRITLQREKGLLSSSQTVRVFSFFPFSFWMRERSYFLLARTDTNWTITLETQAIRKGNPWQHGPGLAFPSAFSPEGHPQSGAFHSTRQAVVQSGCWAFGETLWPQRGSVCEHIW